MTSKALWWQRGVVYQIYPRSFQDSNGDGIGDLPGITQRLDYLQWLGVDALWISPFYRSPMADFGYDVSDYTGVDPIFGTLADFDRLLDKAHRLDLRVVIDFVPNHTSDQHAWFMESRASRDNPKRDWYLWADPAPDGGLPNNWASVFGGSAWEWDAATGQYYLHSFLKEQPDLNWRNPEVQEAMLAQMRFWLERGVDGFRLDVINHVIKDAELRDNPPRPSRDKWGAGEYVQFLHIYDKDRPEVFEITRMMRRLTDAYPERVLIGEVYHQDAHFWARFYGTEEVRGLHIPFNFRLLRTPWKAEEICNTVETVDGALEPWMQSNYVLGNHDTHRIASRVGRAQARIATMLLLTLRGTPTLYYGDEIDMEDVDIPLEAQQDPYGRNVGDPTVGRDAERTPMQWDASAYAGFSTVAPWLPVAEDAGTVNVAVQRDDPRSLLTLTRRLLSLRRAHAALHSGDYQTVMAADGVYAYLREAEGERFLVVLNFTAEPRALAWPDLGRGEILLSTSLDREGDTSLETFDLRPNEGVLLRLA